MSYHIIDISTNGVSLSVKDGQLVCKNPDGSVRSLPMEDIGAVLVNTFSANFHSSFISSAAEHKIAVIVCEKFRPVSMVLPVQRASDTIMTRSQIQAPMRLIRRLWEQTVTAKCINQYSLAERISIGMERQLMDFRITMHKDDLSKEANCARLYWELYSNALRLKGFRRFRDDNGLNGLLNYGYAVLMLRVEQKLLACGLDPLYGMGHVPKERSLPLAYDIMEPFRPAVDEAIYEWAKERYAADPEMVLHVDLEYKRMIQGLMERRYGYGRAKSLTLDAILEMVIKSFRSALTSGKEAQYKPWIRRNSKWDG